MSLGAVVPGCRLVPNWNSSGFPAVSDHAGRLASSTAVDLEPIGIRWNPVGPATTLRSRNISRTETKSMRRTYSTWYVILFVVLTHSAPAGDSWPEWRGVTGQGVSDAKNLPVSWSETENVAWKVEIPGEGWSTPVVDSGQVWITLATHVPASKENAERRRQKTTNAQPLKISESVSLRAAGYDLTSGELIRNVELLTEKNPQMVHRVNSYATPSPILEDGRLYCHYGPYGIACMEIASGDVLWTNRTLRVKHENGPGSSPVLWKDLLIIHCDGIDQQYIVAINKHTGKQAWRTPRSGKLREDVQMHKSYATSLVVNVDGAQQIVSPASDWVYGYDPETGHELWKLKYGVLGFSNASRPIAGHGLIFTCTGYMKAEMLAISLNNPRQPEIQWRAKKQIPNVASPLLIGDEIYCASDAGIASCIDAKTGEPVWTQRIGDRFWASPLYADGRIYFFNHEGTTTVITPGRKFTKLAVNRLDGMVFASGAAVDGSLIQRTDKALYCLR